MILLGTMSSNQITGSRFIWKKIWKQSIFMFICILDWTIFQKERFMSSHVTNEENEIVQENILSILVVRCNCFKRHRMRFTVMSCFVATRFLNFSTPQILRHNNGTEWFRMIFLSCSKQQSVYYFQIHWLSH